MKNETIKINGSEYAPRVIFDNGGGVIVQLPGFAHYYDDGESAAVDVIDYIKDNDTSDWDGNEEETAQIDPSCDDMRNGGYMTWAIGDDIDEDDREWGNNTDEFFMAISPVNADLDDDDKTNQAQNLLNEMRDEDHSPVNPMVRINLATGKMGVESDLNAYGCREVNMGDSGDFAGWIDPDLTYDKSELLSMYDMVFDAAKNKIDE